MALFTWVEELVSPCFTCKLEHRAPKSPRKPRALHRSGEYEVELVVSPLAGLRGVAGYHSSVLVAGEEYYFSPFGICCSPKVVSHEATSKLQVFSVGCSQRSGPELLDFLTEHFRPGTYDLLRKNCNSFTDCALYFLCSQRLDPSFRVLEEFGLAIEDHAGLLRSFSLGAYVPNTKAAGFDLEEVIASLDEELTGFSDSETETEGEPWPIQASWRSNEDVRSEGSENSSAPSDCWGAACQLGNAGSRDPRLANACGEEAMTDSRGLKCLRVPHLRHGR
mmetsp:Transcript_11681/g.36445  ORF Transcript_11681/g.36445 Transcript_11681/m.36445 type:complete len:278 (+) Transcript_11681:55-888(+)